MGMPFVMQRISVAVRLAAASESLAMGVGQGARGDCRRVSGGRAERGLS